jgi:hypothetical protein
MLLPLLALMGARIFGIVLAYRSIHEKVSRATFDVFLMSAFWMAMVSGPGMIHEAPKVVMVVLGVALLSAAQLIWIRRRGLLERRFEITTIKPLVPLYVLYLLLLMAWPLDFDLQNWRVTVEWEYVGYLEQGVRFSFVQIFVAFTLLGYMVGQLNCRSAGGVSRVIHYTGWVLVCVVVIVFLEGYQSQHHVALSELTVICLGYLSGLLLYLQQRRAMRGKWVSVD